MKSFFVYILTNAGRVLYVGVTNDLARRIAEHRSGLFPGFSRKYHLHKLVYYEQTNEIAAAIAREKQIKGWTRARKIALIESTNPDWNDLAE